MPPSPRKMLASKPTWTLRCALIVLVLLVVQVTTREASVTNRTIAFFEKPPALAAQRVYELAKLDQSLGDAATLAGGDFDEDGIQDLVIGHAGGVVALHPGNPDSIYSDSPQAHERRMGGDFSDQPFLSPRIFPISIEPEFLGSVDFDGDSNLDIVATARKSRGLWILSGDGRGGFAPAREIALPGEVSAMMAGPDGTVVGVATRAVFAAMFFRPPTTTIEAAELFRLPAPATDFALGHFDDDEVLDIAVAAGSRLLIVHPGTGRAAEELPLGLAITSMAAGAFERESGTGLALLGADGQVRLVSKTGEGLSVKSLADGLPGQVNRMVTAPSRSRAGDSLVILDNAAGRLRSLTVDQGVEGEIVSASLEVGGLPVAALPMRLNADAREGFVVLLGGNKLSIVVPQVSMTFTVTNTNDAGLGSLRQAILDANATPDADTINFNIPGSPPFTIALASALPAVTNPVIINGTTQPGFNGAAVVELNGFFAGAADGLTINTSASTVRGLAINRFTGDGIVINGTGNIIEGNIIGTNSLSAANLGNSQNGVLITASGNTVGGAAASAANKIAFNGGNGVSVAAGTGNSISSNSIFSNSVLGINLGGDLVTPNDLGDVDVGANDLQNFPVLSSATNSGVSTGIIGTLPSKANTTYRVEFFSNLACNALGSGEGAAFIGAATVNTDGSGNANFNLSFSVAVPAGQVITATATDPLGNTSEFSACVQVGGVAGGLGADLSVTISMLPNPAPTGSEVTKTILVSNLGPGAATSVTVTDNLSSNLTFVSCLASLGGVCGGSGNSRTITFASIPAGATAVVSIVAGVNCSAAGGISIGNTAAVFSAVTPDPNPANNLATAVVTTVNTPPQIACPANVTRSNAPGMCSAAVSYPAPVVTDAGCSIASVICVPPSGSTFEIGTTTVNCTATDSGGATAACSFNVTVNDVEPLTIVCPSNVVLTAAPGQCTPSVSYPAPTVSDNCPSGVATCTPPSGSPFPVGTTTVTCTAVDAGGIRNSCTFTVTVNGSPRAEVRLQGGAAALEFGPLKVKRKPRKEANQPSRSFAIENTGCVPLVIALDSIERIGSDVDRGRITDPDDRAFFSLQQVNANGSASPVGVLVDMTINPGQSRTFRVLFNPVIPAVPGTTRGLRADQVLPDVVTSRLTLIQNGGPPIQIALVGRIRTRVLLIDPDITRRPALVTFARVEDDFVVGYSVYDPNLDLSTVTYQFFDRRGRPAGPALTANLADAISSAGLTRGQSFTVLQAFAGAKDHDDIVGVTVEVSDSESSDAANSVPAATSSNNPDRLAFPRAGGVLALPGIRLMPFNDMRLRRRQELKLDLNR